jgi:ATP-dependent DNA ligase
LAIRADLPVEVDKAVLTRLCPDPRWGYQEKFNGEYRTICKDSSGIHDFNRNGDPAKGLPSDLIAVLKNHPLHQFIIAGELVGNKTFKLFDALILGDEICGASSYEHREARYHQEFDGFSKLIQPVYTARAHEAKAQLVIQLLEDGAEGVIVRDMTASYVEGKSGNHFKVKFWKTLDAVVLGPDPKGHHSVRLACYDDRGILREVCGAKILDFHPKKGDVVEVKYNKGTRNMHIMEIHMERIRTDKVPAECLLSQIVVNKDFRSQQ